MKVITRIKLLWIIFYICVTGAGINSFYLASNGLSENDPIILQLASLISITLTALSCLIGIDHWKKQLPKK